MRPFDPFAARDGRVFGPRTRRRASNDLVRGRRVDTARHALPGGRRAAPTVRDPGRRVMDDFPEFSRSTASLQEQSAWENPSRRACRRSGGLTRQSRRAQTNSTAGRQGRAASSRGRPAPVVSHARANPGPPAATSPWPACAVSGLTRSGSDLSWTASRSSSSRLDRGTPGRRAAQSSWIETG
jgi:hypothetical protein